MFNDLFGSFVVVVKPCSCLDDVIFGLVVVVVDEPCCWLDDVLFGLIDEIDEMLLFDSIIIVPMFKFYIFLMLMCNDVSCCLIYQQ